MTKIQEEKIVPKIMLDYLESLIRDNIDWDKAIELTAKHKDVTINGKPIEAKKLIQKKWLTWK